MFLLGQAVGKYQVLSNLGSGGFGTVFLAKDAWIDKKVAIKVPTGRAATSTTCCWSRACWPRWIIRTSWASSPPSASKACSSSSWSTSRARAWRRCSTVRRASTSRAPWPTRVQILKGVEHAHENQILHRDLRPANVLVSESGIVKVADFGTSRLLEKSHATTVIGSPPYMAP